MLKDPVLLVSASGLSPCILQQNSTEHFGTDPKIGKLAQPLQLELDSRMGMGMQTSQVHRLVEHIQYIIINMIIKFC